MIRFYFSHLFKQLLDIASYQYLLKQRIELTKHLLKSDHSIIDIAFLYRFNSYSYLSKQIYRLTSMTLTAYRANQVDRNATEITYITLFALDINDTCTDNLSR